MCVSHLSSDLAHPHLGFFYQHLTNQDDIGKVEIIKGISCFVIPNLDIFSR